MEFSNLNFLCTMCGCGSLFNFASAVRGNLSDNGWTRHQSMSIEEYQFRNHFIELPSFLLCFFQSFLPFLFACCIWFYPRSLGYPFSSSWRSRQCRAWTSSGSMGFKLNQCMAIPTFSQLPLPHHILQAGQIVSPGYCDWICLQVSF